MIRPITVICWILALGAGLYLYRAKHEVELMDKHIDQIARETADIRADSRRMLDNWIRLGEPEQLHKYSDQYLGLKTVSPTQFVRLADLPNRLPAPRADPPAEQLDAVDQVTEARPPGAQSAGGQVAPGQPVTDAGGVDEADAEDLPVPPIPPVATTLTSISLPAVTAVPLQARPVTPRPLAGPPDQLAQRPHAETRVVDEPRPATKPSVPLAVVEQHPGTPAPVNGQIANAQLPVIASRGHELPPLQAQGQGKMQGLAPLQAQGPASGQAQGQTQGQALAPPAVRLADSRTSGQAHDQVLVQPVLREPRVPREQAAAQPGDSRMANAPLREVRSTQPQQADSRGSEAQAMHQGAARPPAPPAGSLLGSRGAVPLPLPAPTPVSATWTGPIGPPTGPPTGPGR